MPVNNTQDSSLTLKNHHRTPSDAMHKTLPSHSSSLPAHGIWSVFKDGRRRVPIPAGLTRSIATCSYPTDKHKDIKKAQVHFQDFRYSDTNPTSSTDAEYIAALDASNEAVWIRKFISGLGIAPTIKEPISMYCDNTGAMAIAKDDGVTKGARNFRAKVSRIDSARPLNV
ncbi:hypothetical protein Tco_0908422 [Tanacetum coccineum]|uniref:Uncharacterized protein n=1 Tax=Tanacetum coccineum TaxID=301880 RepID=A0ABQ5CP80_9ASTR